MNIFEAFEELDNINEVDKEATLQESDATDTTSMEDRAEIEGLCKKIDEYTKVTPSFGKTNTYNGLVFLTLVGESFDYDVESDDFDDDDDFKLDKVLAKIEESVQEEDYFTVAYALGIDEAAAEQALKTGTPVDIPGSTWKLFGGIDIEPIGDIPKVHSHYYDPGNYWNPPEYDFEYDETMAVHALFYLVKPV